MNKHQILYPLIFVTALVSGGLIGISYGTSAGFDVAVDAMRRGYLQGVTEARAAQMTDATQRAPHLQADTEFRRSLIHASPMPVAELATPITKAL